MSTENSTLAVQRAAEYERLARVLRETHAEIAELRAQQLAQGESMALLHAPTPNGNTEKRRQHEAQSAAILNSIPAQIALLDSDGRIVDVNKVWSEFGISNDLADPVGCMGRNYIDVCDAAFGVQADEAPAAAAGIRAVLNGEARQFSLEYPCHSPEEQHWFRLLVAPLDRDFRASAIVMHIDITERKQAESRLQERDALLTSAQRMGNMGSWHLDLRTGHLTWCEQTCRLFGVKPKDFPGTFAYFLAAVLPEDRPALEAAIDPPEPCDKLIEVEYRIRRTDGQIRRIYERGTIGCDEHQTPITRSGMVMDITERHAAEVALATAQRQLNNILDSVAEGIYGIDIEGRVLFENVAALRILGYAKGEAIGHDAHALFHHHRPDGSIYPLEDCPMRQTLADGKLRRVDDECLWRKDGTSFPVDYACSAMRDEHGAISGSVVSFRDITERKKVDERLAILDFAREHTHEAMYLLDGGAKILDVNEGACRALGYSRTELLSMRVMDIEPTFTKAAFQAFWQDLRASGTLTIETSQRRKDGGIVPVEVNANYFEYAGRGLNLALVRDISERLAATRQLAEQAALLEEASDGIIVLSLDHDVLYWSRGAETLFGWSSAEVKGNPVGEVIYKDAALLDAATSAVLQGGSWSGELQHLNKQGALVTVFSRWTLLRDVHGRPKSFLTINTDVTQRKKLEQQFLRAQRMESIGTLAGGIAHDLNNILTPILLAIEILKDEIQSPEGQEILETLRLSAERGAGLIKQVLGFARGVEGKRVPVNPFQVVVEIKRFLRDTLPRNIELKFSTPTDIWQIYADPNQIHQVLMNLCVNACDAMPKGGTLSLSTVNILADKDFMLKSIQAQPGRYIAFHVEDTGIGMNKAM